jgi:hypothetical protein
VNLTLARPVNGGRVISRASEGTGPVDLRWTGRRRRA